MKAVFVMAGGGTGGHVMPGLAVAQELRRRGHEVVFAGTGRGLESVLAPRAGFRVRVLRAGPLQRVSWAERLRTAAAVAAGLAEAGAMLEEEGARAVLSLGGYAAGPVVLMAVLREIPVVVMEPNAVPGLAHRLIGPLARRALLGFQQAGRYFPEGRWEASGVPVREEFFRVPPKPHEPPYTVLITGGSQGSHKLNTVGPECFKLFRPGMVHFVHQAGEKERGEVERRYGAAGGGAEVAAFLPDMAGALARADVVVCRAGASTAAELCAAGRASILVPFPYAADQHQMRNAEAMQEAGAARVVADRELTGERLYEELRRLLEEPGRLEAMEQAARRLAKPHAARRAADVLERAAGLRPEAAEAARHVL